MISPICLDDIVIVKLGRVGLPLDGNSSSGSCIRSIVMPICPRGNDGRSSSMEMMARAYRCFCSLFQLVTQGNKDDLTNIYKGSETRLDSLLFGIKVLDELVPVSLHIYIIVYRAFSLCYVATSVSMGCPPGISRLQ